MVSKYDIRKYINENGEKLGVYIAEENIYFKKDGRFVSTLDEFLNDYRKKTGESFECVYSEHGSLFSIIKCTECGTIIFTYEDDRYDEYLKCPTCTDYKTNFEYWTEEVIEKDEHKQKVMETYEDLTKREIEANERQKRRKGKYDWQISIKKIKFLKKMLKLELECDNITNSYLKGLRLNLGFYNSDDNNISYTRNFSFTIPLSISAWRFYFKTKKRLKEKTS